MKKREPIVQERTLPAALDVAFRAWSDPQSLAIWMCPAADMTRATATVDFRVGGRFRIVMHGEKDYEHTGEYLVIEPDKKLVFSWISHFVSPDEAQTRVTVTFEPAGERETRLRLVHDELPATNTYDGHVQGWVTILTKLSEHLARG